MENYKIKYKDIIDLGFTESVEFDPVYFDQYGFDYSIISLKLTKKLYLDWEKETQLCLLLRIDKHESIRAKKIIKGLEELKELIEFFKNE
jgi:hypothetical protein